MFFYISNALERSIDRLREIKKRISKFGIGVRKMQGIVIRQERR
jgi:hypothetical protein